MTILNLYDTAAKNDIVARFHKLTPTSQRIWGKMDVAQMLAHCKGPLRLALRDRPTKRSLVGRLIGWSVKKKLYNDEPWKPGLPTDPGFIVKDERNFDKERSELLQLMNEFYKRGPAGTGKYPHPFFGSFTSEQWGKSLWKHMDHHLRQFGV